MGGVLKLARAIDAATAAIGKSVAWLILVAIVVSAVNATVRKIFNVSSNAWLELQWYLFGAAFLLASANTLRQNEHIRIDILYGALKRSTQHWVDLIGHVFFLMPFVVLMDVFFVPWVWLSFRQHELSTNAGGLILWPAKSFLLLGFLLLTIQGVSEIIKKVAVMKGLIEDPTPFQSSHSSAEIEAMEEAGEIDP